MLFPPPHLTDESWYEIDAQGFVTRFLYTSRDTNGQIVQQAAGVGATTINLTTGESSTENPPYQLTLDDLSRALNLGITNRPGHQPSECGLRKR